VTAAPTALPRLPTPLSSWPPLPVPVGMLPRPMPLFSCFGARGGRTTKAPSERTISSAFGRSFSYRASILRAIDASSMRQNQALLHAAEVTTATQNELGVADPFPLPSGCRNAALFNGTPRDKAESDGTAF